jgi:starch-binding outer membrane protein, SusD/RagB family
MLHLNINNNLFFNQVSGFKRWIILSFFIVFILISSCKKFVEVPLPADQLTSGFVFTNDNSAVQALNGIYSKMMENQQLFSSGLTTLFTGLYSDELYYYTPSFRDEFLNNQITSVNHGNIESNFWDPCYRFIYAANKCIEGASNSNGLSGNVKNSIIGEAKFIRAFCYFHLVNLFGDVPLALSTTYQKNQSTPRTAQAIIYSQIINDLIDAQNTLDPSYVLNERIRPNKFAATALLARVYLYNHDWANAEKEASLVIHSGIYKMDTDLNAVFQINSNETIWQLCPVNPNRNTWEGYQIIPASGSSTPTYLLTNTLINAFESGDERKIAWVQSRTFSNQTLYYPFKYKVNTGSVVKEYYVILRLAEQYLIRAEARTQLNNLTGAQADLNIIRNRAGLLNTFANSKTTLLSAIEQERRIELFAEWGHRWFDLKRTNRADAILGVLKSATWKETDTLWPIPQSQILLNPALTQNPGY